MLRNRLLAAPPALVLVAAPFALVAGCHDAAEAPQIIDLGTPRQLVYVGDDVGAPKHGGGSTGEGMVHVFEFGGTFAHVGEYDVGVGLTEVHATPDGSFVYSVSSGTGDVSFLDTTTYALSAVDVGVRPTHSFITPDHAELWVGNDGSSDVSVIGLSTRTVTNTVLTGSGHHKVAFATTTNGALLAGYVSNIIDGSITPVGADHTAAVNVTGVGPSPHGMDFSTTTRRVYNCSGDANNSIEVIAVEDDPSTVGTNEMNTVVDRFSLASRCSFLHVDDAGGYVYATSPDANLFVRIRLVDGQLDTFATDAGPDQFAIVGTKAYVVHGLAATVSVIDLTGTVATASIPVGNAIAPSSAATEADRGVRYAAPYLFVPNAFDGTVSVIDTTDDTVAATLTGMDSPVAVAVAGPGGGTTYPR